MNWQEFEDGLKDRVGAHETPLDTDALWDKLQPKKKRRLIVPLWWLLGGICLLGMVVVLGRNWAERSAEKAMLGHSIAVVDSTQRDPNDGLKMSANGFEKKGITGEIYAPKPSSNLPTSDTDIFTNSKKPTQKLDFQPYTSIAVNTEPAIITQFPAQQHTAKKTIYNEVSGNTSSISTAMPALAKTETDAASNNNPDATGDSTPTIGSNSLKASNILYKPENIGIVNRNSIIQSEAKTLSAGVSSTPVALSSLPISFIVSTDTANLHFPARPYPVMPARIIKPVKNTWQIGIHTGLYSWGIMRNTAPSSDTLPLARTEERLLEAVVFGIHGQKRLTDRWRIRVGVEYAQFNSVFEWQKSWLVQASTQEITNYFINGDISKSVIPGATLTQKSRTVRNYNQITAISLPIDLQYRLPVRQGVLLPFIGVQPNFSQRSKGTILDKQGEPDKTIYSTLYTRNLGLSVRLGLAFECPLGKRTTLSFAPTGGFDLTNRVKKGYTGAERFWQFGMTVGVTRSFF